MKRIAVLILLACMALPVFAEGDSESFSVTTIGDSTAAATNARTIVVRGMLEAIKVDVTAGQTCDVSVASAELTLFSKSTITADATFLPRAATHTTAGAGATFLTNTGEIANVWYDKMPLAGAVTVTAVGKSAGTNAVIVTVVYSR